MLRRTKKNFLGGQSILEYSMVLGIIMMVLFTFSPYFKRSLQGMVKMVADQVGYQNEADQSFDRESGHMVYSNTWTHAATSKVVEDVLGRTTYTVNDQTDQASESESNLGFTSE